MNLDGFENMLKRVQSGGNTGVIIAINRKTSHVERAQGWIDGHYGLKMRIVDFSHGETTSVEINCADGLTAIERHRTMCRTEPKPSAPVERVKRESAPPATNCQRVLDTLEIGPKSNSHIVFCTGLTTVAVNNALVHLKKQGQIERPEGVLWQLVAPPKTK